MLVIEITSNWECVNLTTCLSLQRNIRELKSWLPRNPMKLDKEALPDLEETDCYTAPFSRARIHQWVLGWEGSATDHKGFCSSLLSKGQRGSCWQMVTGNTKYQIWFYCLQVKICSLLLAPWLSFSNIIWNLTERWR